MSPGRRTGRARSPLAGEDRLVDGGRRRPVLRLGPLVVRDAAVTGRQEGRGAVARGDVEAERAARAAAEDGVATRGEGLEGAGGLLEGRHAGAETLDGGLQPVPLGAGDRAVGGHQDLVGTGVDRPRGARDGRPRLQGPGAVAQLAHRVVDLADLRARLLGPHDDLVVVAGYDVDDEPLLVGVVVGAGEGVTEQTGEPRGEVRRVRRLERPRRRRVVGRAAVLGGIGAGQQDGGSAERHHTARRHRGPALRNSLVTQPSRPPGTGSVPPGRRLSGAPGRLLIRTARTACSRKPRDRNGSTPSASGRRRSVPDAERNRRFSESAHRMPNPVTPVGGSAQAHGPAHAFGAGVPDSPPRGQGVAPADAVPGVKKSPRRRARACTLGCAGVASSLVGGGD